MATTKSRKATHFQKGVREAFSSLRVAHRQSELLKGNQTSAPSRVRIGARGHIVIPKAVRDELGLRPGDAVHVFAHEGHAHIEKLEPASWARAFYDGPKKRLPKNTDFDELFEASYDA